MASDPLKTTPEAATALPVPTSLLLNRNVAPLTSICTESPLNTPGTVPPDTVAFRFASYTLSVTVMPLIVTDIG